MFQNPDVCRFSNILALMTQRQILILISPSDTLAKVKAEAVVDSIADTLKDSEAETLSDTLGYGKA